MKKIALLILMTASFSAQADCTSTATQTDFGQFDLNGDGVINNGDMNQFSSLFGTNDPRGDYDGDGIVGFSDFTIFRSMSGLVIADTVEINTVIRCTK